MVSVTSDVAAGASFQNAQPKAVRPDPSPQADSFAALIDSATAADVSNAPSPAPQPQSAADRPSRVESLDPRRLHCRSEAENKPACYGDQQREGQDTEIE